MNEKQAWNIGRILVTGEKWSSLHQSYVPHGLALDWTWASTM